MRRRTLIKICIVLTTAVITSLSLSEVYRVNIFNNHSFHDKGANSAAIVPITDKNKTIVFFNPTFWLPIKNYNDFLSTKCEFDNCILTTNRTNLYNASAIVYCLMMAPVLPKKPPILPSERNADQVWIYLWAEPPVNHIGHGAIFHNEHWRNALNWTMTYAYDSDVLFPYGSLRHQKPPAKNYEATFERKTKLAAWIVSNCYTQSKREVYVRQLQNHGIKIDILGRCGKKTVDSDSMRKEIDSNYKFYLAFENSLCKDYISEKFFKYFSYDVVLVVRGGGNYSSLLPNDSYINTADFDSVKDLAKYLVSVGSSQSKYINYLRNKDKYQSITQDIRTESFCKVCEKLNNLKQNRRTYTDLLDNIYNGTVFPPRDIT